MDLLRKQGKWYSQDPAEACGQETEDVHAESDIEGVGAEVGVVEAIPEYMHGGQLECATSIRVRKIDFRQYKEERPEYAEAHTGQKQVPAGRGLRKWFWG